LIKFFLLDANRNNKSFYIYLSYAMVLFMNLNVLTKCNVHYFFD